MSPRRTLHVLGPAIALGALGAGLACGCTPWSLDLPAAAAFVDRGLSEAYGVALRADPHAEIALLPLPRIAFTGIRLTAGGPDGPVLAEGGTLTLRLGLAALLAGRAEPVSLALDGARVTLPQSDDDARWSEPLRRLARTLAGGDGPHPRRVTLSRATVSGRDPRDGRPETARDVDLSLSWPLWSDSLSASGGFTWNSAAARFALDGLRPGDLLDGRESPFSASLTWPAGSLSAEGTGRLGEDLALTGRASLATRSLPETLGWLGSDIGLSPLIEGVSLDGTFEATAEGLRLPTMRIAAGGAVLEGAGSAELNGRRPSIRATLDARDLNLSPLLGGLLRVSGLDGSETWAHRPIALAPLTGGDLDLRLSGGTARLGPVVLGDVAASVIVRGGGIDATLSRANLRGGTLKGRAALSTPRDGGDGETEIRAQGSFDGVDLGALLVDLGESGWVLGASRGSFSLDGRGRDADSLVRRVAGRALLSVEGGAIAGLDLADVIHRGGTIAHGGLARRNGRTAFDRAGLAVTFVDGIGTFEDGALTARALSASLRGRISLPERRFLARAALLPRRLASGEADAALAAPVGATLFEIAGPWDAVAVRARPQGEDGPTEAVETLLRGPGAALPTQVRAYAP